MFFVVNGAHLDSHLDSSQHFLEVHVSKSQFSLGSERHASALCKHVFFQKTLRRFMQGNLH